jgi:hypothetical protein
MSKLTDEMLYFTGSLHASEGFTDVSVQRITSWADQVIAIEAERDMLQSRWDYIKTDISGARALLLLLREGKGTSDEFDTMVDRIIESRKGAGLT